MLILCVVVGCTHTKGRKPLFRYDLHPFGFLTQANGRIIGSFSDINFLSDDLLLVTVNTRVYGGVDESLTDQPPSKLLLFDVSRRTLFRTAELPVEKNAGSVRSTSGGQFVLLNESGLHLCSAELQCGLAIATKGPLFVSPAGTRIVVGGNGKTEQMLLDAKSLTPIEHFPWMNPNVIPGDDGLLMQRGDKLYIRLPHSAEKPLTFGGIGVWPEARFLNGSTIADFESNKALAVASTDGTILFRVPVSARWHVTDVVSSASGSRFCFHEGGYTTLNSIVHFYDIDNARPLNFESVNVMTTDMGKSLFILRWNPRPYVGYLPIPALSSGGDRLAVIRNGFLEVYSVP
jgi:hypothetical protein